MREAMRAIIASSAAAHISGDDTATAGSALRQHAMLRAVSGNRLVEGHRLLEDDAAAIGVDLEDDGAEALGAGVEAEVERHEDRLLSEFRI